MAKDMIGRRNLLIRWSCLLVVSSDGKAQGGSSHRRCTEQEVANKRLEQQLKAQEEYNMQMLLQVAERAVRTILC
jgi:hypothetical protein